MRSKRRIFKVTFSISAAAALWLVLLTCFLRDYISWLAANAIKAKIDLVYYLFVQNLNASLLWLHWLWTHFLGASCHSLANVWSLNTKLFEYGIRLELFTQNTSRNLSKTSVIANKVNQSISLQHFASQIFRNNEKSPCLFLIMNILAAAFKSSNPLPYHSFTRTVLSINFRHICQWMSKSNKNPIRQNQKIPCQ